MKRLNRYSLLAAVFPLAACSSLGGESGISDYTLVRVHRVNVGDGGMSVVAPRPWNERRRSILFKKMQIVRGCDVKRNVLVYMVYSDRLIEGSPKNSTSSVPVMPWGANDKVEKCADWVEG